MSNKRIHLSCTQCGRSIPTVLEPCPHCGYQHPLSSAGLLRQREKLIRDGAPWENILTKEEKSRLDGWDVTILEKTRKGMKGRARPIDMDRVHKDVDLEMGPISDERFQAKVKKLEDMALLRRYVTLNI